MSGIAETFVTARREARALAAYPGAIPADLATAYAIQDLAIALTPDRIVGWKVGYIAPALQPRYGAERLVGPVFSRRVQRYLPGETAAFAVYPDGFGAVEGEFIFALAEDAPAGKTDWTAETALNLVASLHIGVENAGSPFGGVNALGPAVTVSDFGNNAGLIVGPTIEGWRGMAFEDLTCETFIDGASVGRGTAASLAGGPGQALAFLLNTLAERGRPARQGDLITTGAVTGIHEITAGQSARVSFGAFGDILCLAEMARPEPA